MPLSFCTVKLKNADTGLGFSVKNVYLYYINHYICHSFIRIVGHKYF